MQYPNDPIDQLVDEIKTASAVLSKVLFAGVNIVIFFLLFVIVISAISLQ